MVSVITREELKAMMEAGEEFVLVDVLSPDSYRKNHLPGAINIPVYEIEAEAPKRLPKDAKIVVYCASFECQASPTTAKKLEEMGFEQVIDFEGGLEDWKEAGYPFEAG